MTSTSRVTPRCWNTHLVFLSIGCVLQHSATCKLSMLFIFVPPDTQASITQPEPRCIISLSLNIAKTLCKKVTENGFYCKSGVIYFDKICIMMLHVNHFTVVVVYYMTVHMMMIVNVIVMIGILSSIRRFNPDKFCRKLTIVLLMLGYTCYCMLLTHLYIHYLFILRSRIENYAYWDGLFF